MMTTKPIVQLTEVSTNRDEAMQYSTTAGAQGICSTGWHIPTDAEQNTLDQYLTAEGGL